MQPFVLAPVSRFLNRPWAPAFVAVTGGTLVFALISVARLADGRPAFDEDATALRGFVIFCVVAGACGYWGALTWRRLWRAGRTPCERAVYDLGVRTYGAWLVLTTLVMAPLPAVTDSHPLTAGSAIGVAGLEVVGLLLGLPLLLWTGYALGSFLQGFVSPRWTREEAKRQDLPPPA